MNRRRLICWISVLGLLALATSAALAQGGGAINWWVIASGGAPSTGGSVVVSDTLGQAVIGPSGSGAAALGAGYWYGAAGPVDEVDYRVYLPLAVK
jgi:hypothetical protein